MSYGKVSRSSWTWPTSCTTLWTDSRCPRRLWWPNTSCPGKCRAKCKTWTGSNLWAVCTCLSCQMALNTTAISWKLFSNFNRIKLKLKWKMDWNASTWRSLSRPSRCVPLWSNGVLSNFFQFLRRAIPGGWRNQISWSRPVFTTLLTYGPISGASSFRMLSSKLSRSFK